MNNNIVFALVLLASLLSFAQAPPAPTITTMVVPHAIPSQNYSFQMHATCDPCSSWVVVSGLPSGFSLSSAGVLSGSSSITISSTPFTVQVMDSQGQTAQQIYYFVNKTDRTQQWPNPVKVWANSANDDWFTIWVPQANDWQRTTFDVVTAGLPNRSSLTESAPDYQQYVDGAGWRPAQVPKYIQDVSAMRGWSNYENVFLHATQDYYVAPDVGASWQSMDMFDAFDEVPDQANDGAVVPTAGRNGIIWCHNGVCADITVQIYKQNYAYQIHNGNYLYIGYSEPFDQINIGLSQNGIGGTATYQYWNGSAWTTLSVDQGDTTNGFTSSGKIQFTPPSDWTKYSVNSSRTKWWVRITISGMSTEPTVAHVYGDDWYPKASGCASCNASGWSSTDAHRVNQGLGNLEYNPHPPPTATARFRYRARATGYAAPNYMFGNPNNIGSPTQDVMVAQSKAAEEEDDVTNIFAPLGEYHTGAFFDNIGYWTQWDSTNSDLVPGTTIGGGWAGMFAQLVTKLHTDLGNSFTIAENISCIDPCKSAVEQETDMSTMERAAQYYNLGDYAYALNYMDPYASGTHMKASFFWDNSFQAKYDPCQLSQNYPLCPSFFLWPRGDRGPMHALGAYLMGMNDYTIFFYDVDGWSYKNTDEVYVANSTGTTLTATVNADTDNSDRDIYVADDSSFVKTNAFGYILQIGNEVVLATKGQGSSHYKFNTTYGPNYLMNTYVTGTIVKSALEKHLSTDGTPPYSNVLFWSTWFPAIAKDFGQPDIGGWNGGARGRWYTGAQVGGSADCLTSGNCPPVERRDFTKALVLQRAMGPNPTKCNPLGICTPYEANEWNTGSKPIALPTCSGCQWKRLHADGTIDASSVSVTLMGNETAIFLKQ